MTPPGPAELRIRNLRYPRWVVVAENVFVGGILVSFLVIELVGLWLFDLRTTVYVLLACLLAIMPVVIHGWLLIWDLRRPGPGRGVTARALYERVVLGVRRKELASAVEWTALTAVRTVLPVVHPVALLRLGEEIEVMCFRYPPQAVRQVRFAPDPAEDYKEVEPQTPLREASIELHSGRQFRLIVDQADARRLKQWAAAKGIAVCEGDGFRPRLSEPVPAPDGPDSDARRGNRS